MAELPEPQIGRAKQVFQFLKAFAERSLPIQRRLAEQPWSLMLADIPAHASISTREVQVQPPDAGNATGAEPGSMPLLSVRRPALKKPPQPPTVIADWLNPGWTDPNGQIGVKQQQIDESHGAVVPIAFAEDAGRVSALEEYRALWEFWAVAERPARAAMQVFERLYELKGRFDLESERIELVVGDGRLKWQSSEGSIDHPVLIQPVDLEFDASIPEFRVIDSDRAPELYIAILQSGIGLSAESLNELRSELEAGAYHPLSGADTSAFLKRLAQRLGPRGSFQAGRSHEAPAPDPRICRDAALFLRVRPSGFPAAFDRVLEDLDNRGDLPKSLTSLVGIAPTASKEDDSPTNSPWSEPPDVLLSRPANLEQIAIARALDSHQAVLVQGPPGTGKSHTIANLIGHLVANGKRVLVTSHTTKALRVLRDQVVEALQPLCVAVLDHDLHTRTQMEQSVREILARLTTAREDSLSREVEALTGVRAGLIKDINRITDDLRVIREAEYLPITIGGVHSTPSDAARWVRAHDVGFDWIPGPVQPGAPMPLDSKEIADLYHSNAALSAHEEREIEDRIPDLTHLPDSIGDQVAALGMVEAGDQAAFWSRPARSEDLLSVERLSRLLADAVAELRRMEPWQEALVAAGHDGGIEEKLWLELRDHVVKAVACWQESRSVLLDREVRLDGTVLLDDVRRSAIDICKHLDHGGSLGSITLLLRARWKSVIRSARVNGEVPRDAGDFRALVSHSDLTAGRDNLTMRWNRQAVPAGLPPLSAIEPPFEPVLNQYAMQFEGLVHWWNKHWSDIAKAMTDTGLRWEALRDQEVARSVPTSPFEQHIRILCGPLQEIISARIAVAQQDQAVRHLAEIERHLELASGPVCARLRTAIRQRDAVEYKQARVALQDLHAKQRLWRLRRLCLEKLNQTAPAWGSAIAHRQGLHGLESVSGDPQDAWRWRQLSQEIERRAQLDELELTRQLHHRRDELREVTARLIERMAWLSQLRRTDHRARQSLQGWADTQRRIGKGTGKRVPELQARARQLLAEARDAVPVWIMPLARVAESFDPRRGRFDVVIVDEASQSDVTGLLAWYMGHSIAIVGDHEQVSPLAVGQDIEITRTLIASHLHDIPNNHLYDGQVSIYDLARQCFGGTIALREHFRCVPDIIEFSNRLSYSGEIRPLRNPGSAPRPHVVEYIVKGGSRSDSGKTNLGEAQAIAAITKALVEMPECAEKTIGAVTLLGDEQAYLIQDLVLRVVGAVELDRRRFIAGNSAQFQGDERDIIFLSMVDSPAEEPLSFRQTSVFKQRYNVAASRAKDQMWLIHSLDPERDLKAGDLRRALIEHVRDPGSKRRAIEKANRRAESPFEKAVIEHLMNAGYAVEPQVWVGQYRIDMVVSDGANEIAIECDGDRFHGLDEIPGDLARQAILERAKWRFIRIRGTWFYRDPMGTMARVIEELQRLGVSPKSAVDNNIARDEVACAFRDRVVRRAWEILRERGWLPSEPGEVRRAERGSEPSSVPVLPPERVDARASPAGGSDSKRAATSRKTSDDVPPAPEDLANVDWVAAVPAAAWFGMSHWAKISGKFQSWERSLLFSLGKLASRSLRPSVKQARQGRRLFEAAQGFGWKPDPAE